MAEAPSATSEASGKGFTKEEIADHYAKSLNTQPDRVRLVGAYDVIVERAAEFAGTHGGKAYGSYAALLADSGVDVVLNLTIQH